MAKLSFVLDTNVVVAAARNAQGPSGTLVRHALLGKFAPIVTTALLLEYAAVLLRPEHRHAGNYTAADIDGLLDAILAQAREVTPYIKNRPMLDDAGDEHVLDAATNGAADALVTFNRRDFAPAWRMLRAVVTPSRALEVLGV